MKKVLLVCLISTSGQLFGQESNENSLTLTKEFIKRIFDMQPFDSIARLTTLDKNISAKAEFCAAYYLITNLRLQIQNEKYSYEKLSYIPYAALPSFKRTLVYEKFLEEVPREVDLSSV